MKGIYPLFLGLVVLLFGVFCVLGCDTPAEQQARNAVIDAIRSEGQEAPGRNEDWYWCENPLGEGLIVSYAGYAHWLVRGDDVLPINGLAKTFTMLPEYAGPEYTGLDFEALLKPI